MRLHEGSHPKWNLGMIPSLKLITRWAWKVGKVLPKADGTIALDLANVRDIVSQSNKNSRKIAEEIIITKMPRASRTKSGDRDSSWS